MKIRPFRQHLPQCADGVYIDDSAVVIGDVVLAQDVSVWCCTVIRGDVNAIRIGARSNIQDGSVLHVGRASATHPQGYPLIIGEDVTVGHKVLLHGCTIGERVLVGMGAIILDGAEIESDTIIGAGSLVPPRKKLAGGFLYMGSPAQAVRELNDGERAFLKQSAEHYVKLAHEYLTQAD